MAITILGKIQEELELFIETPTLLNIWMCQGKNQKKRQFHKNYFNHNLLHKSYPEADN